MISRTEAERIAEARVVRAKRRTDTAAMVRSAREVAGWSRADLARAACVSPEAVRAWEDPEESTCAPMEIALIPEMAHLLEQLAIVRGVTIVEPVTVGERPTSDLHIAAGIARECGEANAAILEAVSDGYWTRPERDKVRAELREAIRALTQLDVALEADGREPVVGVRGLREVGR